MTGQIIKGFACPQCGDESLVYNGNYYCVNDQCWAMDPDRAVTEQPTWELELMVAYMDREDADRFAIYTNPLKAELARRERERIDYGPQFDEGDN